MSFNYLTDEQLKEEVARRLLAKQEAASARAKECAASNLKNIDALLLLCPSHGRTSCSDINPCNRFGPPDRVPPCVRCYLLGVKLDGYWDEEVQIEMSLSLFSVPTEL